MSAVGGPPSILVVDDEIDLAEAIGEHFASEGFRVLIAHSGEEAALSAGDVDAVLTDVRMPRGSGLELARRIQAEGWRALVYLMTGYSPDVAAGAGKLGVRAVFAKPFDVPEVVARIARDLGR